uniref:Uncharacterized protein n=1 Tax=Plectus sambesii TaxID=2011161 RepID=A0A914V453_9BILA
MSAEEGEGEEGEGESEEEKEEEAESGESEEEDEEEDDEGEDTTLEPFAFVFSNLQPSVLGPVTLSPNIFSPANLSPALLGPTILSPSLGNPSILSPYALSPSYISPKVFIPFAMRCDSWLDLAIIFSTILFRVVSAGRNQQILFSDYGVVVAMSQPWSAEIMTDIRPEHKAGTHRGALNGRRTEPTDGTEEVALQELPDVAKLIRKRWFWRQNRDKTKKKATCYFKICGI